MTGMEQTRSNKVQQNPVTLYHLPLRLRKNVVELFPQFWRRVVVDGSSRPEPPQVCAMDRLANPSKVENWTEIHGTQMTSAPVTYLKKDFSWASSIPLTKRFRNSVAALSELFWGSACIMLSTFRLVGSPVWYKWHRLSIVVSFSLLFSIIRASGHISATYWGFWIISLWATLRVRSLVFSFVGTFLQPNLSSTSINSSASKFPLSASATSSSSLAI